MRRWLLLIWFTLLMAPAIGLFGPWERSSVRESRMLGQPPHWPRTLSGWLDLPRETDAFVRDQFAGRDVMIRINSKLRGRLNDNGPNQTSPVLAGNNGYLLLREGLAQSAGVEHAPLEAAQSGALICQMQQRLEARGARFLFAIAPSPAEIYPEIVPEWVGTPSTPTDYDLLMQAAQRCGAHTLDLRPVLRAQRDTYALYRRTDTHWTEHGALLAYDAVVDAIGQHDWRIEPERVAWRQVRQLGDLTRMTDAEDDTREVTYTPVLDELTTLAPVEREFPTPDAFRDQPTFIRDYPREGFSVLVIGDSFTRRFFPMYLAPFVRRVSFVHHQRCGLDWRDVERAEADIVLYMPTERAALCQLNTSPRNFG